MSKEEIGVGKTLYKIELLSIKVIPYLIALCYVGNCISSYIYEELPIFSFVGSLSILPLIFLYISSFVFRFCIYHRLPLYYVFVSDVISYYDLYVGIPISNRDLFAINMIEQHLALYVKDTIDDPDACDGFVFNRWIADMKWMGIAIPWEEFL